MDRRRSVSIAPPRLGRPLPLAREDHAQPEPDGEATDQADHEASQTLHPGSASLELSPGAEQPGPSAKPKEKPARREHPLQVARSNRLAGGGQGALCPFGRDRPALSEEEGSELQRQDRERGTKRDPHTPTWRETAQPASGGRVEPHESPEQDS